MQELLLAIFKVYRDEGSGGWGYSYFVKRPQGNILFARMAKNASIENEYEAMKANGGIDRIYITDYHFAGQHINEVAEAFGASIYCSQVEAPKIRKRGIKSLTSFPYEVHNLEDNLQVIPTPGHTSGGVCYLLTMNDNLYLFTGDLLYFDTDKWIIGSKEYAKIKASFECIASLDYNYLIGCGDDVLGCPYIKFTLDEKRAFFQQLERDYA